MSCKILFLVVIAFTLSLPISSSKKKYQNQIPVSGNHEDEYQNDSNSSIYKKPIHRSLATNRTSNHSANKKKYIIEQIRNSFTRNPKGYDSYIWDELVPVIKGSRYIFSHEGCNRDVYMYNEIFTPSEPNHFFKNYFNSRFNPDLDIDSRSRKKRCLKNLYRGDVDIQFTSDDIDEYVNLKIHKLYKRRPKSVGEAFLRVKNDLSKLAKVKSINDSKANSRNKLKIEPDQGNIEVDSNMPSDVEHLDRNIQEEIIRVYIPKIRDESIKPSFKESILVKAHDVPIPLLGKSKYQTISDRVSSLSASL